MAKKRMEGKKSSGAVIDRSITVEIELSENVKMHINIGNCQDQGARNYQEDSFGYSNINDFDDVSQHGMLAVLSDGMGGLSNGKAVSEYVVKKSNSIFSNSIFSSKTSEKLYKMIVEINEDICSQYCKGDRSMAGATAVIVYILKNKLYWVTAGDSRIYCLRNGNLFALNEDHDYKNTMLRDFIKGNMDLASIERDSQKDSLVSFIGKNDLPQIDIAKKRFLIRPNDIYILCSDGIYNGISQEQLKNIALNNDAQSASEMIVKKIVNAGFPGQDNMTVMIIKCNNTSCDSK